MISGVALTAAGTAVGLKKLDYDRIANAGILSAAFFVAALIHVPIGPSNAHLILNGLVGLLLGWSAFPAILVALTLQAVFFQFGGITTLGVNTIIMALPAIMCHLTFGRWIRQNSRTAFWAAFACGFMAVLLSGLILAISLVFTEENFFKVSAVIVTAHIPVMFIEGLITAFCIIFLHRVRPEMLPGTRK